MSRLMRRTPGTGISSRGLRRTAVAFSGFALVAAFALPAHAAESDDRVEFGHAEFGPVEFGLVDVATGLPASGVAIAVAPEELVYPAGSAGLEYARDLGTGTASYYGERFAGRPTASGEIFDPGELTAAHRSLPFGSRVLVTSEQTGQSVVVTINDRGPFHGNRVIDLSKAAASRIGLIRQGSGPVSLALLAQ